jgi:alpha-tubulin suppressor-like RCC1 family protein
MPGSTWASVTTGGDHTCGIQLDGTLWCWGRNLHGQLGLGDARDSDRPQQVQSDATWTDVTAGAQHTCAITDDATLWCWGDNDSGELGLGDETDRSVPTEVGESGGWSDVAAGLPYCEFGCVHVHTCASRSDGSLWCWGDNARGELGLGDKADRLVPGEVNGSSWAGAVGAGGADSCGVQADNTLWCWGGNNFGRLGLGDTHNRKVPTQV